MAHNISGGDGVIISEALALALVALEQLPREKQPRCHMDDMRRLLAAIDDGPTLSLHLARATCRLRPDLDPIAVYRQYGL